MFVTKQMANIQIVFGSNGGNTKLVCEYVAEILSAQGHAVAVDRCEHYPADGLIGNDLLILACGTYEHGELEDHFRYSFWPRIQEVDLDGQKCAVIGLGDSKYDTDYNIESGRILQKYVETHGGELLTENLMIDRDPMPQLETKVKAWADNLMTLL